MIVGELQQLAADQRPALEIERALQILRTQSIDGSLLLLFPEASQIVVAQSEADGGWSDDLNGDAGSGFDEGRAQDFVARDDPIQRCLQGRAVEHSA